MNILKSTFQLLVTFYLAYYLASNFIGHVIYRPIYTAALFIGFILLISSSWRLKFNLFALMIFFPLTISNYFHLPFDTVVEPLALVLCIFSIIEIARNRKTLFSSKALIYFVAMSVLALWGIIHYILNPVLGQITFGVSITSGGLRNYFIIFAGISTFFCSYWFLKNNELNVSKYFPFLLAICLVLGVLYMIGLFVQIPITEYIILGSHDVTSEGYQYSSIPLRVISALSTALMLSLFHNIKWGMGFISIFILIIIFMVFGGGRSSLPVLSVILIAYIIFINRKYFFPVLSVLLILSAIYVLVLSDLTFSEYKFGRAFKTEGGLKEQSEERYYSFLLKYEIFKKSPILGKGMGYIEITGREEFFKDYPEALRYFQGVSGIMLGSHGTYMSILSIFGLGGFFWLMVFLLGGIYHSYRFIKINDGLNDNDTKIAIFVLLQLLSLAVSFYVGGDGGYENLRFWFLAGIIAGLISKDKEVTDSGFEDRLKLVSASL